VQVSVRKGWKTTAVSRILRGVRGTIYMAFRRDRKIGPRKRRRDPRYPLAESVDGRRRHGSNLENRDSQPPPTVYWSPVEGLPHARRLHANTTGIECDFHAWPFIVFMLRRCAIPLDENAGC
jgi:hypothetical protein